MASNTTAIHRRASKYANQYSDPAHIEQWRKKAYEQLDRISDKWKNGQPDIRDRFVRSSHERTPGNS